jgi:cell division protein FtsI (penicillin-binding protein 3)
MIRRPLRPLARILLARARGDDPDLVEAEERAARLRARHRAERQKAETRLLLLGVVFILGFTTVAGRMALLSASEPVEPRAEAAEARIAAQRSDITDRNGAILATNMVTASLYAQPELMIDPHRAARELARIFPDLDAEALAERLTDGRRFMWIRKTVAPEQRQLVHDLGEPGLLFGPRETRLYPNGAIASHLLGGAGYGREGVHAAELVGVAGIELDMDARLRDPALSDEPLRLSIDLGAQVALEEVLADGMTEMGAKGAVGILMEIDTGPIRALFNRAAQGRYELGSTFKVFPVAQALEAGLVSPGTMIDTKGPMRWGRFTIRDFRDYGPRLSIEDVIVKSSNIGTARLAVEGGAAAQKEFLGRLGLLEASPVELPEAGRTAPLLPDRWSELTTMTISYGHGIAVTPLHLASAYATLLNGGLRVQPSVIASDARPTEADRVLSERTSRQVRDMLRQVVMRGTARFANVEGYEVGGKTGTADKPNYTGGYARDKVISTFAGVFPTSAPRYVLIITLDEPQTEVNGQEIRTAGWTAVPVAANAIRRIAPILGMRPLASPVESAPILYTATRSE